MKTNAAINVPLLPGRTILVGAKKIVPLVIPCFILKGFLYLFTPCNIEIVWQMTSRVMCDLLFQIILHWLEEAIVHPDVILHLHH